jgi:DNA-binding beta-propeller fold protein YncE
MRLALVGVVGGALLVGACGGAQPNEAPRAVAASGASRVPLAGCARRHPGVGAVRADGLRQSGTVALARAGAMDLAYVADEDAAMIRTIDVGAGTERARTPLAGTPSQLMVLADGRVAVALRDKNQVQLLEPAADAATQLAELCRVDVPDEPVAMAATPDDASLLVSSAWARRLTVLDAGSLATRRSIEVPREPRAVVVADDGKRAFVAHVVGARMSVVDLDPGGASADRREPRNIDLRARKVIGDSREDKMREGCQGFALAKSISGKDAAEGERPPVRTTSPAPAAPKPAAAHAAAPTGRIFAPMVTVEPGDATVRSSGYGNPVDVVPAEAPIVSVVDAGAERTLTRAVLSDGARHTDECLLPRAAAFHGGSGTLLVTCLGNDVLVELDARGADPSRLERRRWKTPAGPTGVAVDAARDRAVVWSQFDRALTVIELAPALVTDTPTRVSFARDKDSNVPPLVAWGRELFHRTDDRRISGDGRACASCHPDGREDALTWSTPEGPRQTIMLAGRTRDSAPFSWLGAHADLKTHIRTTFRRLGGGGLPDAAASLDETDALVAYLEAMPAPSPAGIEGQASDRARLARRGHELFFAEAQGCASCHLSGTGTDASAHDVGSRAPSADARAAFDTPSLRFVSGTAPYFHDGRYATLDALLGSSDGKMGHTLHLSREDVVALRTYLETL